MQTKFSNCDVVFNAYSEKNGENLVGAQFNPDNYGFFI